ncbi:MAG: GNAT family N-acetyltransferase [Pseudomonadota bacterium]
MSCTCHPSDSICPDTGSGVVQVETKAQLMQCFEIRRQVFIEEQNIPEAEEWDDKDLLAQHFLAFDLGVAVGTARAYGNGPEMRIGRIAVLPVARGTGLGRKLVEEALSYGAAGPFETAALDAQLYALPFYTRLGFVAEGGDFDDGSGILHRRMTRPFP